MNKKVWYKKIIHLPKNGFDGSEISIQSPKKQGFVCWFFFLCNLCPLSKPNPPLSDPSYTSAVCAISHGWRRCSPWWAVLSCASDPETPQICRDLIQMYQNVPLTKIWKNLCGLKKLHLLIPTQILWKKTQPLRNLLCDFCCPLRLGARHDTRLQLTFQPRLT